MDNIYYESVSAEKSEKRNAFGIAPLGTALISIVVTAEYTCEKDKNIGKKRKIVCREKRRRINSERYEKIGFIKLNGKIEFYKLTECKLSPADSACKCIKKNAKKNSDEGRHFQKLL